MISGTVNLLMDKEVKESKGLGLVVKEINEAINNNSEKDDVIIYLECAAAVGELERDTLIIRSKVKE